MALELRNVSAAYGSAPAIRDISLKLPRKSVVSILGPNGAGKSTLARTVAGLVHVSDGSIHFDDLDITRWSVVKRHRVGIAFIPEERGIFPSLTVSENLELALAGRAGGESQRRTTADLLEMFPSLAERERQVAGSLSGGEQQMLSLARAFGSGPRLIIADELSHGLAPRLVDAVFATLDTIKREGVAVLIIEQFVHRALALADWCGIMQDRGSLVWQGSADSAEAALENYYWGAEGSRLPSPQTGLDGTVPSPHPQT